MLENLFDIPPTPVRFPGRPAAADFDLHEDFMVERSYEPHDPRRRSGRRSRDDIDLFPILEPYSKVWDVPLGWLWPGRIPRGKITLLAGDPSVGKSRLAIDLAARVSAGLPWPDDPLPPPHPRPQGNVLLFTAEDRPEDGIRQQLIQAGADLERVFSFTGVGECYRNVRKFTTRPFRIPDDVPGLEAVLQNHEPVRLVVIDTLADYWGGHGTNHNAQVREMLAPLVDVADRRGSAILCISHLNKSSGMAGLYRMMGSLAFTALARSVWGVARSPEDPERRLFLPVKTNLTLPPTGLAFRVTDNRIVWETDAISETWHDKFEAEDEERDVKRLKIDIAERWLRKTLAAGPQPMEDVTRNAAQSGISFGTLVRAKRRMKVASDRPGPFEERSALWRLPE